MSHPSLVHTQKLPAWLSVNDGLNNCLIFIAGLHADGKRWWIEKDKYTPDSDKYKNTLVSLQEFDKYTSTPAP